MTIGALQAIAQAKLAIPADIAVVSFDDMPWSVLLQPPLTAMAQPAYDLGVESARLLLSRLEGYTGAARMVTLSPTLHVRGSSSPNSRRRPAPLRARAVLDRREKGTRNAEEHRPTVDRGAALCAGRNGPRRRGRGHRRQLPGRQRGPWYLPWAGDIGSRGFAVAGRRRDCFVLPLDESVDGAGPQDGHDVTPDELPEVQREVQAVIDAVSGKHWPMGVLERFAFYEAARSCYAVVLTENAGFYGNVLIKKGPPAGELGETQRDPPTTCPRTRDEYARRRCLCLSQAKTKALPRRPSTGCLQ